MNKAHFDYDYSYPVKVIANRSMIDTAYLSPQSLSNQTEKVQEIIEQRKLVKLNKLVHGAKFEGEEKGAFSVWLLQIVFYNFAWYLGFEYEGGNQHKLIKFERLDRLYLQQEMGKHREIKEQKKSLNKLTKLLSASYGIHLGNDANLQKLYTLEKSTDKDKPYRFQVTLPIWSLDDFDLLRWILGFGGKVKVHSPDSLRHKVIELSQNISDVYTLSSERELL